MNVFEDFLGAEEPESTLQPSKEGSKTNKASKDLMSMIGAGESEAAAPTNNKGNPWGGKEGNAVPSNPWNKSTDVASAEQASVEAAAKLKAMQLAEEQRRHEEVKQSEERSDKLTMPSLSTKTARTRTSVQDALPP